MPSGSQLPTAEVSFIAHINDLGLDLHMSLTRVFAHHKVLAWYKQHTSPEDEFNEQDILAFAEYHP